MTAAARTLVARLAVVGLLACAAIAGFVYLYRHSVDIDASRHQRVLALAEKVKQLDSRWSTDVLRSATGLSKHYDPLIVPLTDWPKLRTELGNELAALRYTNVDVGVKQIGEQFDVKAALVDRFKSENATLGNSLRYLPTAHREVDGLVDIEREKALRNNRTASTLTSTVDASLRALATTGSDKDATTTARATLTEVRKALVGSTGASSAVKTAMDMSATDAALGSLVASALRFNLAPDSLAAGVLLEQNTAIKASIDTIPAALRPGVTTLTSHVDVVLNKRAAVADLLSRVNAVPVAASVDRLIGEVNAGFEGHVAQQSTYSKYFQWYVVGLLVCLGGAAVLLIRQWIKLTEDVKESKARVTQAEMKLVQADRLANSGRVAGNIAHEINTPLAAGRSSLEMLGELVRGDVMPALEAKGVTLDAVLNANIEKCLTRGIQALDQIRGTVDSMLLFSRVDQGQISTVQLAEQLNASLNMLSSDIKGRGIVKVTQYTEIPSIRCNAAAINQVFLNIMRNAAEAMPTGGTLTIGTRNRGDDVMVTITDTGHGMSPEVLKRIFEPGFTTKSTNGIGLSISKDTIEEHGGQLAVKSEVGKGTSFAIVLPLQPPKPKAKLSGTTQTGAIRGN